MKYQDVVLRPIVTEKSTISRELGNVVTLAVHPTANKQQIRDAVQQIWKVEVTDVRTIQMQGKKKRVGRFVGRKAKWKKAMVTLAEGQSIEFFEGV